MRRRMDVDGRQQRRRGRFPKVKEVEVVHTVRQQTLCRRMANAWTKILSALRVISLFECTGAFVPELVISSVLFQLDDDLEWASMAVSALLGNSSVGNSLESRVIMISKLRTFVEAKEGEGAG